MDRKAIKDNATLKITKDNVYKIWVVRDTSLVTVVNDLNDSVIMSCYDFKNLNEAESDWYDII